MSRRLLAVADRQLSRRLLAVAGAAGVPFALLAVWAWLDPVGAWETDVLLAFAVRDGPLAALAVGLNLLGDLIVWTAIVLAVASIALATRRMYAGLVLLLTLPADVLGSFVKLVVERARPTGAIVEHLLGGESFAFPSGHVVRATALAAATLWLIAPPAWRLRGAVLGGVAAGLLMGYARLAAGVHWPTDVLGGLLLGLAWFGATAGLLARPVTYRAARAVPGEHETPAGRETSH